MPKLGKFNHFVEFSKRYRPIMDMAVKVECFYQDASNDSNWFDENQGLVPDPRNSELSKGLESDEFYRARSSCVVNVPVKNFNGIVSVTLDKPPRKATSVKLVAHVNQAVKYAEHEYESSHDAMTGLLNIKGFSDAAKKMASVSLDSSEDREDEIASKSTPTIAMFALDIDFFKQVNDTFGHSYGDVVLKCLANRLETISKKIDENRPLEIKVARPSGEEFLVLLKGDLASSEVKEVGDEFRFCVSDKPIPSDSEWAAFSEDVPADMQLPKPSERRLTVSIGVATIVAKGSIENTDWILKLRNKADRALYSAKSNGRNTVIPFSEILQSHGSVVEHHSEMNVVSINLGKAVGSRVGQEFLVYHPDFTGLVELTKTDGRTTKKLGTYPKKTCGCIVVFDAQEDVSFCRVASKDISTLFPESSRIEAIPMGSIVHLVSDQFAIVDDFGLVSLADLEFELKSADVQNKPITSMVFGLMKTEEVIRDRGSVYINECLAKLFEVLRDLIGDDGKISQLSNTQFAVVNYVGDVDCEELLSSVLESVEFGNIAEVACGVWQSNSETGDDKTESNYSNEFAIDYASFALKHAALKNKPLVNFSGKVAHEIVSSDHKNGRDRQVIEQYRELKKIGVKNAYFENVAGVTAYRLGTEDDLMFEAGKCAIDLSPESKLFRENMATYHSKSKNYPEIFKQFNYLFENHTNFRPRKSTFGIAGMSFANEVRNGRLASKEKAIELLTKAKESKDWQFGFGHDKVEIDAALAELAEVQEQDSNSNL